MITKAFAVMDVKAQAFLAPFFFLHTGQAQRAFGDAVRDPNHAFSRNPGDYTLFYLGTFDDTTGVLESGSQENLGSGLTYVEGSGR